MDLKNILLHLSKLVDPHNQVIEIANIAMLKDDDDFLSSKSPIILSIVNIEQDHNLRNLPFYKNNSKDDTQVLKYKQPTLHLNLSLLFSSYTKDLSKYLDGIEKLKTVISYFQQNNSFYYKNDDSEMVESNTFLSKTEVERLDYTKITIEFLSLSMEQLNQMWSYLGSKYMPSVLYKMRLCTIQSTETVEEKLIKKVKINLWENNIHDTVGLIESTKEMKFEKDENDTIKEILD